MTPENTRKIIEKIPPQVVKPEAGHAVFKRVSAVGCYLLFLAAFSIILCLFQYHRPNFNASFDFKEQGYGR